MPKLAKIRRRRKKNPGEPKRNPPLSTDIVHFLLPGFAAFAASRVGTRMAAVQIAKRWPKAAKHAGAIAAVGAFGAAWWGAHKVKFLEQYHDAIVVGSGLAAMQSLVQLYLPKLSPVLGEPCPSNVQIQMPKTQAQLAQAQAAAQMRAAGAQPQVQQVPIPNGFTQTSARDWYTYNDAYDAGGYKGKVEVPQSQTNPAPAPDPEEMQISDLLDNSDLQLDNSDLGLS